MTDAIVAVDDAAVERAARALEAGRLVGFPTETVYGLGADAENADAVRAIYAAKGRPADHPVIVHILDEAEIGHWARDVPDAAYLLTKAFWPGPLTLILKRAEAIPAIVSGGQDSVGLRCPSHPVCRALMRQFKGGHGGIAGPSANKFGHVSPTSAQHVHDEFDADGSVADVLDGGQCDVGIESTIVDLSRHATHGAVLLRPGHISAAQIEAALGAPLRLPDAASPRASGSLDAHYAPHTPVAMADGAQLDTIVAKLHGLGKKVAVLRVRALSARPHAQLVMPADATAYAHELYSSLRAMDRAGADLILLEALPQDAQWQGINDRLRRACHDSAGVLERLLRGD